MKNDNFQTNVSLLYAGGNARIVDRHARRGNFLFEPACRCNFRYCGQASPRGRLTVKKRLLVVLAVIIVYLFLASFSASTLPRGANNDAGADLSQDIENILGEIDLSELEQYIATLSTEQQAFFGAGIVGKLKSIIAGETAADYRSVFSYALDMLGINLLSCAPIVISVLCIVIAFSLISAVKGRFASDSVETIVHFACVALVSVILITQIFSTVQSVRDVVGGLQMQMNIVFPIMLTMMTAIGAGSSAAVYQPAVAVLGQGITELIGAAVLPAFIASIVFTVVGNLTDGISLKKMSGFFSTASKWLLGTAFFLFIAFLSVQGITASVYDGVSVRTAKFALSKYVPVIGGYLSEGLNLVMAGSVLIKNAVGMTAVILLFVSVLPVICNILVFSLSLSLAAAITEPLGGGKISSLLSGLSKNMSLLVAILLGTVFLYFIFLVLVVCTGNLVI